MATKLHYFFSKRATKTSVMKLSVSQILASESAIFHDEGLKVYDEIHSNLKNGEIVELSFLGITTCSTQFMNACIGKAYLESPKQAADNLKIIDFGQMPIFESKLNDVIDNARNYDEYNLDVKSLMA
jgi:hypothetical protein